jgi:hypothetical protein
MPGTKAEVERVFREALEKLAKENRLHPTNWEEEKLSDAMGYVNAGQYVAALAAVKDFHRSPSAQEMASLNHTRQRLSTAEIIQAFKKLFGQ